MRQRASGIALACALALTSGGCGGASGGHGAADVANGSPAGDVDAAAGRALDSSQAADGLAGADADAGSPLDAADAPAPSGTSDAPASADDGPEVVDEGPVYAPPIDPPPLVLGTWNLLRFSQYGTDEYRILDIAERIESLGVDVLGVQEIMVAEGSDGTGPQAWDMLLDALGSGWAGVLTPWNLIDTNVGLLYRTDVVTLVASKALFEGDWWEFPRAPLEATLRVTRADRQVTFKFAVLHLKAFGDSVDRRILACEALDQHIRAQLDPLYVVVGDYNDDVFDPPADNAFQTSFLADPELYDFVTAQLPPKTVSSTGYYHYVGDDFVSGELIDHVIATASFTGGWSSVVPEVLVQPQADWEWWEDTYSDHFPVTVTLTP